MANSKKKSSPKNNPKSSNTIKNIILVIPIIAIIAFVWLLLLKLEQLPTSITFNQDFNTWLNLWMVILVLLIVILICIPQSGESASTDEPAVLATASKSTTVQKTTEQKAITEVTLETDEKPVEFVPLAKEELKSVASKDLLTAEPEEPKSISAVSGTIPPEQSKPEIKPAKKLISPTRKEKLKPRVFEYPHDVNGGLYGDTYVDLGDESVLKLRTLVVKDIYLM